MIKIIQTTKNHTQSGNIFFALFGAVALVGILGVGISTFIKGPLSSSVKITRNNVAETQMAVAAQVAIMSASSGANNGDCDSDTFIEPVEWRDAGALPKPVGGGLVPLTIGINKKDPWGGEYGYCAWNHGAVTDGNGGCSGTGQKRLAGGNTRSEPVVALVSAGPDKIFTTTCRTYAAAQAASLPLVSKAVATDDDLIFTYTYEEATAAAGGLWSLKSGDANTATIGNKNIETSGAGSFIGLTTNSITARTGDTIDMTDGLKLPDAANFNVACNASMNGVMRRNASGNGLEICNGLASTPAWGAIAGGGVVAIVSTTPDLVITPQQNNTMNVDGGAACGGAATCYGTTVDFYVANQGEQTSAALTTTLKDPVNFEYVSNTCTGVTLAKGQSCLVKVRPKATGNVVYTGTLKVNQNNAPTAILQGEATGFGCSPGRVGGGGIYVACNVSDPDGTYNLIIMPPGCNGVTSNPTCSGSGETTSVQRSYGAPSTNLSGVGFYSNQSWGARQHQNLMAYTAMSSVPLPAAQYCDNMTYAGKTDWFMPSYREWEFVRAAWGAGKLSFGNLWYLLSDQSGYNNLYNRVLMWNANGTYDYSSWDRNTLIYVRCIRRDDLALPAAEADGDPDTVAIAPQVGFSPLASVTSNTVTVQGILQTISVSITPTGSGQEIVKNGTPTGSASISGVKAGDTLAFKMNVPNTLGTKRTATIAIGADSYTWWAGYADQAREIKAFVTSTVQRPVSINGLAGADAICTARAGNSSLGLTNSWKSILSSSTDNAPDRMPWNWGTMKTVTGTTIVDGGFSDFFDGTFDNPLNVSELGTTMNANVWTGTSANGVRAPGANGGTTAQYWAQDWTYSYCCGNSPAVYGSSGSSSVGLYYGQADSDQSFALYCIENIDDAAVDTTPNGITIPYAIQVAPSTRLTSAGFTIGGMSTNATTPFSVSASSGTPTFTINGGAEVTSGTVKNGDVLVFRLTAPATASTSVKMDITAGSTNLGFWRIWTGVASGSITKRVFVTSQRYQGNMGGVTGADSLCQARANAATLGGTWKAIISGGSADGEWAINRVGYNWTQLTLVDGTPVVYAPNLWSSNPSLLSPIVKSETGVEFANERIFTNTDVTGLPIRLDNSTNCSNWTSNNYYYGSIPAGMSSIQSGGWIYAPAVEGRCEQNGASGRLYCIEQ